MATQSTALPLSSAPAVRALARDGQASTSLAFDRLMIFVSAWFIGGIFVDGWAHVNLRSLETFFTPWHALLYSGFFATAAVISVAIGRGHAAGYSGWRAIPAGYELAALGAVTFMLGGVGDGIWHTLFGIEVDLEALLSPTHLLLATGTMLMLSAPLRAAWHRARGGLVADGWTAQLPMWLSLTFVLMLINFFTQYIYPLGSGWAARTWAPIGTIVSTTGGHELELPFLFQAPMMAGVLLQSAILVGFVLLALRNARFPFGSMTLLIGLSTALMVIMRTRFVADVQVPLLIGGIVAGVLADVLVSVLRPSLQRPISVHLLATLLPMVVYGTYFATLALAGGMWWTIHLWGGAIFLAGVVGLLLAILAVPGRIAADQPAPA
jgi:hypothetical protein